MLQLEDLVASASDVTDLRGGVGRCKDRTRKSTFYNYVKFAAVNTVGYDLLVTSENMLDDDFAMLIFANVPSEDRSEKLSNLKVLELPKNEYGFSALLLAPKDYHRHFAGRLGAKRDHLVWCLPIHRCEFSGDESAEEFFTLCWRGFVPPLNWQREVCPKIILRYDNPKTQGGTLYDRGVFAKYGTVLREVDLLSGVPKGFIEIINYKKKVIEILSPEEGVFVLIRDRDDATREPLDKPTLLQKLQSFLVQPPRGA